MPDFCLVSMPYGAVEQPSLALGLFKTSLKKAGFSTEIVYANFAFAESIGLDLYNAICGSLNDLLAGEWTFSPAAFPDFHSDPAEFLANLRESIRSMEIVAGRQDIPKALLAVREQTPAFIDRQARAILATNPRIVGCTSMFQQHCASLALLRRIRELEPGVITLLGGSNCAGSMGVATHQAFPWVDFVVSGEADELLPRLAPLLLSQGRNLTTEELPRGVMGSGHRHSPEWTARLEADPPWASIPSLDATPFPDFSDFFQALRSSPLADGIRPGLTMEMSRGCWWGSKKQCRFCGLNGEGLAFRTKSADRILAEMHAISSASGLRNYQMADNIFAMSFFKTLLPRLQELGGPCNLLLETKANLTREQIRQLSQAGIHWMQPGIESLDDDLLQKLGKGTTAIKNVELLKWTRESGVYTHWLLLFAIPGDTDEQYRRMSEWLPLLSHLQPPMGLSAIRFDRFSHYQRHQEQWNLHLEPGAAYQMVYPLPPEQLARLAYFFENTIDGQPRRPRFGAENQAVGPGLVALRDAVARWHDEWRTRFYPEVSGPFPASLAMADRDGQLTLLDTRNCAVDRKSVFTGHARDIYLACEHHCTLDVLQKRLAATDSANLPESHIREKLAEFEQRRLILHLGRHYLSLATRWPIKPSPRLSEWPGGRVLTPMDRQLQALRKAETQALADQITKSLLATT
ncbi:MAG: RiPP maturation radical SAM C-methyltransferase [Verrucomicrobiae bacterium]|nr:RiPP maturation radical SAM C-methyltransferase [Verrucomicrobiae bacterium]